MNRVRCTLALAVTLALVAPGCDKGSTSKSKASDRMEAGDMTPADPMGALAPDAGATGKTPDMAPDPMATPPKASDGPTGIAECDQILELTCRCKDKEPALAIACDRLKADAPGKKAGLATQEPDQTEDDRKACLRALTDVKSLPGCQ